MDSDAPTDEIQEDDQFLDALEDFPFYDCISDHQFDFRTSDRGFSSTNLHRRKFSGGGIPAGESEGEITECSTSKDTSNPISTGRSYNSFGNSEEKGEISEVNESNSERVNPFRVTEEENNNKSTEKGDEFAKSSSSLVFIAKMGVKASRSLISLITLSTKVLYFCYLIFFNPFQAILYIFNPFKLLRRIRNYVLSYVLRNSWNTFCGYVKSSWNLMFGWGGLFWAVYVCCVLVGLFIFSLVVSGILMRPFLIEPIKIKEVLNFDYTKYNPVALVPISSCAGIEKIQVQNNVNSRVFPPDHKFLVTVSFTLSESVKNRNLGAFQVRVDFLSDNGTVLASKTHPGMLKLRSDSIRSLQTFLQAASLLTGLISESQTLNLKIRGLNEGNVPTSCLRVAIEQRAEFKPGAGLPELYNAFLVMESDLPLYKRIIWYWKKIAFVWISVATFTIAILLSLMCCRSIFLGRSSHYKVDRSLIMRETRS